MNASIYSTNTEVRRDDLNASARIDRDDARVPAIQIDLMAVFLFIAIGLWLTVVIFMLGFGAEIGQILGASG